MRATRLGMARILTATVLPLGAAALAFQANAGAAQRHRPTGEPTFKVAEVLAGASLSHTFVPVGTTTPMKEPLSKPDDITSLHGEIFVGFQNGVGPQGQPSTDGNTDSTVVELTMSGKPLGQWNIKGKCDGVTADPQAGILIATVNEDANSSLYVIDPSAPTVAARVQHYHYSALLPHYGGTDAISDYHGELFISASAPGTTGVAAPQASYPAVYAVTLDPYNHLATAAPLFYDEDNATVANVGADEGKSAALALTDPDSNEVVPPASRRFAGDFVLTSQGDLEQIYVSQAGSVSQKLNVLSLSQAVDDTAFPSGPGRLFTTDSTNDAVDVVTGPFSRSNAIVAATPCDANSAPATCPAPPAYPPNYLASLNLWTGAVTALNVVGVPYAPQGGLLFVPGGWSAGRGA